MRYILGIENTDSKRSFYGIHHIPETSSVTDFIDVGEWLNKEDCSFRHLPLVTRDKNGTGAAFLCISRALNGSIRYCVVTGCLMENWFSGNSGPLPWRNLGQGS